MRLRCPSPAPLLAVVIAGLMGVCTAAPLVLNNVADRPYTREDGSGFLEQITREVFRRAGAEFKLVRLPPERGLRAANEGQIDGELVRVAGLDAIYPDLVRVPESHVTWRFSAFTRRQDINMAGTLRLDAYAVGIQRGSKILEATATGAREIIYAHDRTQLFRLLEHNRVDMVFYSELMGLEHIRAGRLEDVKLLQPPLATREMFIYLHRRHSWLVPALAAALRSVKADGTYARLLPADTVLPETR